MDHHDPANNRIVLSPKKRGATLIAPLGYLENISFPPDSKDLKGKPSFS
jgi:hypothetical protein